MHEKNQIGKLTHVIIESRGNEVDNELRTSFSQITKKNTQWQSLCPLEIIFTNKKANNIGLQIADLVAYPIGRFITDPGKENKSMELLRKKFYGFPNLFENGLTILPHANLEFTNSPKNEKPRK